MFIPVDSDVELKAFPFVTLGLIAVNTVVFFCTVGFDTLEPPDLLILQFSSINPLQWLTHGFMHIDYVHLGGNMFFLWTFGMIVEAILGSGRFLSIYLIMDVLNGIFVQIPMFVLSGGEGAALGASGVIFGVMAIAVLLRPEAEIECVNLLPPLYFKLALYWFVLIYLVLQLLGIAWSALFGQFMSSEMLHAIGLAIGTPIGIGLIFGKQIDTHCLDAFSKYWLEEPLGTPVIPDSDQHRDYIAAATGKESAGMDSGVDEVRTLGRALWGAINANSVQASVRIYQKLRSDGKVKQLPTKTIAAVAQLFFRSNQWKLALATLQDLTSREREMANGAWLQIAQIQLHVMKDKRLAKASLRKLRKASQEQLAQRDRLWQQVQET